MKARRNRDSFSDSRDCKTSVLPLSYSAISQLGYVLTLFALLSRCEWTVTEADRSVTSVDALSFVVAWVVAFGAVIFSWYTIWAYKEIVCSLRWLVQPVRSP